MIVCVLITSAYIVPVDTVFASVISPCIILVSSVLNCVASPSGCDGAQCIRRRGCC